MVSGEVLGADVDVDVGVVDLSGQFPRFFIFFILPIFFGGVSTRVDTIEGNFYKLHKTGAGSILKSP